MSSLLRAKVGHPELIEHLFNLACYREAHFFLLLRGYLEWVDCASSALIPLPSSVNCGEPEIVIYMNSLDFLLVWVGGKQFHSELWSYPWGETPVWGWTAWANWSWTEVGKGGVSLECPGAAFSQETTECLLLSLSAGCSAEWPRRSGTSPPAAGPSSRPSPPAHPLASTPSATTARAAPPMLAVATALRWVATPTAWTHRPCSTARGLAVGPAASVMMTAPVPSWRIRPPSASTCLMRSPSGSAWCAGTLLRGTTTAWLPVRHAKPSSRGLFKVRCTTFC